MAAFAVTTAKGPSWEAGRDNREQQGWDQHAAFMDRLVQNGIIVLGGPISSDSDGDVALLVVEADDEQHLRSIFSEDPWATNRVLRLKHVRRWTIWLDGRRQGSAPQ
jgi:uncharacterized protein